MREQRRLAAIVSADVAGYSRLMGLDDSGTLARLKAHRREVIDPKIAEFGGRIVKTSGDGLLLEFPSVVEAVRCAVDVQRGMAERNTGVPVEQRIEFRIGINVGDIIIDGDDIFGDGVNVAARLQALAEPGGICASKVVRDQVLDKLSFRFDNIGAQQVKNIARPVEAYWIRDDPLAASKSQHAADHGWFFSHITRGARRARWTGAAAAVAVAGIGAWYAFIGPKMLSAEAGPPFMSVAVIPFTPASVSADDERFAERLTQDLTSAAERAMRSALVVSHGLAAKYKDKSIDPRAAGSDLNVRYLVQGDVRDENGAAIVSVQLVETTNGTQLWSVRLVTPAGSKDKTDIVAQLTNRLRQALSDAEAKRVARLPIAGANAAELVMRGSAVWDQDPSLKGTLAARKLYREALRQDSGSVSAMLGLTATIGAELLANPHADKERLLKEMDDLSSRAVRADREDPRAWQARTWALAWQEQWDGAFEASAEALRIDPYRNGALYQRALLLLFTGRPEDALPVLDRAIALDPRSPLVSDLLDEQCGAHLNLGHYDDAIAACEKSLAIEDQWYSRLLLVGAYAQKGDMAKAAADKAEVLKRKPDVSIASLKALRIWQNPIHLQQREAHLFAGLRKAGFPEQ